MKMPTPRHQSPNQFGLETPSEAREIVDEAQLGGDAPRRSNRSTSGSRGDSNTQAAD
jgi:hypothetical protein